MQLRVINDIHIFGVNPSHTLAEVADAITNSPHKVILNGDIVDIKNCKYSELPQAYQALYLLINLVKIQGGVFIRGNHESNATMALDEWFMDGVLFTHGDIPSWGRMKSLEFRMQKRGAGFLKRAASKVIDNMRRFLAVRPNERCIQWIKDAIPSFSGLEFVIMGHSHPLQNVIFDVDGIKCAILKRGINDLDLSLLK